MFICEDEAFLKDLSRPYLQILDQLGKKNQTSPETNTPVYYAAASVTKKRTFYDIETWADSGEIFRWGENPTFGSDIFLTCWCFSGDGDMM